MGPQNSKISVTQVCERNIDGLFSVALSQFLTLPDAKGQHGGLRVGYDNCPRYLNNTQFVDLARDGWIGGDHKAYQLVTQILAAGKTDGKSAMFAVIKGSGATTASDRRKWNK
jgi:hypothetical protein